jgi:4-amino-4-deoxy-L-arabinose transferase-like glycosyltransferase
VSNRRVTSRWRRLCAWLLRSSSFLLAVVCAFVGAILGAVLLAMAENGADWKLKWDAIAALATALAVVAAVAMWRFDAAKREEREDNEAKIHILLLLPHLSEVRRQLDAKAAGLGWVQGEWEGIADALMDVDPNLRIQQADGLLEMDVDPLHKAIDKLGLLPRPVGRELVSALMAVAAVRSAATVLREQPTVDDDVFARSERLRHLCHSAQGALANAHAACENFVIEDLGC